ncbi:beta-ketoacyl [acyl carrier protein] synthase domain-containing protein [Zooshikella harenae]|uniref:Polyketide synthase n=1 Tax=Zooshikella harenae TaxID=2827238 RepID=A0ABS5ZCN2_9GAMM|nr:polyketide synthase [Zooshikella harenae]MBU2711770.1 polyketide synthase [Zooshikella harenae]
MKVVESQQPLAIVGVGCLYPQGNDVEKFWHQLVQAESYFSKLSQARFQYYNDNVKSHFSNWQGSFFDTVEFDLKRFRIPPIYRKAIASITGMYLDVAEQCFYSAALANLATETNKIDVICGTCFGFDSTYLNALKIEGVASLDDLLLTDKNKLQLLKNLLQEHFGCTSHDRVGEMASSIPARVASYFGLRGRVQAIESADVSGYFALESAALSLQAGLSDAVMVITGQCIESLLMPLLLSKKGFEGTGIGNPFLSQNNGILLGEGAAGIVLKRLADAKDNGDHIYAVISGFAASTSASANGLKYNPDSKAKVAALEKACHYASIETKDIEYFDCISAGGESESVATLRAIDNIYSPTVKDKPLYINSSVAVYGHTFANAVMTGVLATSLAIHHKNFPASVLEQNKRVTTLSHQSSVTNNSSLSQPWYNENNRYIASIMGSALNGLNWNIILSNPIESSNTSGFINQQVIKRYSTANTENDAKSYREPIAIVGLGGAFGQSDSVSDFWQDLLASTDHLQRIPNDLLPRKQFYQEGQSHYLSSYAEIGAALKKRDLNLARFKLFPKRLALMDRVQKVALAIADEALQDYGFSDKRQQDINAAIIVASNLSLSKERENVVDLCRNKLNGIIQQIYPEFIAHQNIANEVERTNHLMLDGSLASGTASLIAQCMHLPAAPYAIEAACASTFAALQNAVLALQLRRYDFVLAGGIELPVNLRDLVLCSAQMMLSKAKISPFADQADGFSPGDGAAFFVLKRLSDAQRAGDKVYATIDAIGGSADAGSMTAPDAEGQTLAIQRAFAQVNYKPSDVQYVEAHGTGTRLGDMAELTALNNVYGNKVENYVSRTKPLMVGSVKASNGHTFSAAGGAGLMKTVLALHHKIIPATLLRRNIDPQLPLIKIPAEIISCNKKWPENNNRRYAAVSSFGTGGINYHLLVSASDKN